MAKREYGRTAQEPARPKAPMSGGSSLLVIFAVLCLVVFAMLSLATLQADRRLFDSMTKGTYQYYAADNAAQETLARLRAGEIPDGVEAYDSGAGYTAYHFTSAVSDTMCLDCLVEIGPDGAYTVYRWSLQRSIPWEGNFDTPVFLD